MQFSSSLSSSPKLVAAKNDVVVGKYVVLMIVCVIFVLFLVVVRNFREFDKDRRTASDSALALGD